MKIKFNKFERVAGLFVLSCIIGGIAAVIGVAVKKGWFENKVPFETTLRNADGLHSGTMVQMAGLRAGSVTHVELRSNNDVFVRFEVSEKFHDRIRQDSIVRAIRPFIIGEKIIDISVGTETLPRVAANSPITAENTMDLMDLISGRTLGSGIEKMGKVAENFRFVAEALLDPERTKELIRIFDEMAPLVKGMSAMSTEVTKLLKDTNRDKKLVHIVNNLHVMTNHVNKALPMLNEMLPVMNEVLPMIAKESPHLVKDLSKISANMAVLTEEMSKTLPALKELGPELPRASRRAIEALDETVVTLKALQKSFLLRGNVRDVRDEESTREQVRVPASNNGEPVKAPVPVKDPETDEVP